MKHVKAVAPYFFDGCINFKHKPYYAWVELGGEVAKSHYPPRWLHGLAYRWELPQLFKLKKEARLRFMQPYSMNFDAFPDYAMYEVIPFFWDVWPNNIDKVIDWLRDHDVKTAFFTSSQVVEIIKKRIPTINSFWCPEGIDANTFKEGKLLKDRELDFFHYGREIDSIVKYDFNGIRYFSGKKDGVAYLSHSQLIESLSDAKIVAAYPKSWSNPDQAGEIETLTQRYWECMLSRCVIIGHAPQELIDLLGYNPVIELDKEDPNGQLRSILANIDDYQSLAARNRENALSHGDWKNRMNDLTNNLKDLL